MALDKPYAKFIVAVHELTEIFPIEFLSKSWLVSGIARTSREIPLSYLQRDRIALTTHVLQDEGYTISKDFDSPDCQPCQPVTLLPRDHESTNNRGEISCDSEGLTNSSSEDLYYIGS